MRWSTKIGGREIAIYSAEIEQFKRTYVDEEIAKRMSDLLLFDMYVWDLEFGIGALEVVESINSLEAGELHNGTKSATVFKNPPLKGLWHKHVFSARFLPQNIALAHGRNGLKDLITEIFDPSKPIITAEMIEELSRRATNEHVERRDAEGKLTGEWLVFAKHGGENYYLSLNTHGAGDQFIYDRIMEHCPKNFPELQAWISASVAAP